MILMHNKSCIFQKTFLNFGPFCLIICPALKVFFLFNIHYTYTFLNHNIIWVLLLTLKISVNVHLNSLQNILQHLPMGIGDLELH